MMYRETQPTKFCQCHHIRSNSFFRQMLVLIQSILLQVFWAYQHKGVSMRMHGRFIEVADSVIPLLKQPMALCMSACMQRCFLVEWKDSGQTNCNARKSQQFNEDEEAYDCLHMFTVFTSCNLCLRMVAIGMVHSFFFFFFIICFGSLN